MNLPEREVHPTHLRTVAGAVLREVVLHLPPCQVRNTVLTKMDHSKVSYITVNTLHNCAYC